ncbi:type II toxin-antitoxin system HipA family toxin [Paraburkholderia sprentiae WSM5005]|uniref:Type II toxin-antitoxin system HipA family toxin n=1 Tax=Paraburkholderia sprentiae WSM5005 TaxID=754502 RepID=A0A1I9YFV2_9BURK|nr:HipA domain-containing protein [Paraburkholderia sprentiae]APA85185.1 type II toxin-antitoxin system HipA family toxin [Paraburkholderia sprentiae WSM5005]
MISKSAYNEAFVWTWLPGATEPVVAGRLVAAGGQMLFNYGQSYLARDDAIPLYVPELPLRRGTLPLLSGLTMPGCIRDAAPDAWGRRVIINRKLGMRGAQIDTGELDEMTYLLESGSDRIGALDFQLSPSEYAPRETASASLDDLQNAVSGVERGVKLSPDLERALFHGSSIGGARPKAMITTHERKFIAKFSSQSDVYSVVKAEYIAMRIASLVGIDAAPVKLEHVGGKDVLLIERFDRTGDAQGWQRRAMVSALTLFELDEMMARYASYQEFATLIRHRFTNPGATLRQLFARLLFNVLCGNTDDHARNHAAYWDGRELTLTPAYDICPQARAGNEATQAMLVVGDDRFSRIDTCLRAAPFFLLSRDEAVAIARQQIEVILAHWDAVCTDAQLSEIDRGLMWRRQFLNPFAFEGAPPELAALLH